MINIIKNCYHNSDYGYILINPVKRVYKYLQFLIYSDEDYVKKGFKQNLGYELNLDNPQTFNEKLQWLKLNVQTELHTICADKLAVREYIKEQIGEEYLIPLIFSTSDVKKITSNNFPDYPVIIKSNHDSGKVLVIKDKSLVNWKLIQLLFASILKNNFYYIGREQQYKNIKPTILIEKLLLDKNKNIPNDYKLHCFNGKLLFTQVDKGRFDKHTRSYIDIDWNLLDCKVRLENEYIEKPKNMDKMQKLAEILAKPFDYVRVDFYSFDNNIYFGELTFCPGSGWDYYSPLSNDYNFGKKLDLSTFSKEDS